MRKPDAPATCLMCGELLPKGSSYSRRFCDRCAYERNLEMTRERRMKKKAKADAIRQEKLAAADRAYCRTCVFANHHDSVNLCNYILITGKMRGCPAGVGCERRTVP